jgi:PAS domain-containing protein
VSNELLRKAEDQKWLIEEMKNNPHGVAETIARGIGIAASQLSFDQGKSESAMDLLLANVRRIGESLVGPESDESAPDRPTLEQALLNLEKEVRTRSRLLTSDAVAAGFINEVMAIVTSYSDQVRARRLSNEFLKGESGLKRAEQLLRRVTPDGEDTRVFVERIRELLTDRGVPPAEIDKALTAVETQAVARKARKAKPRRRFPEAVADGIAKRIAELGIPSDQRQSVVDSIGSFVEQRVRERAVQVEEESAALLTSLKSRDEFLRNLPWGVLLWDSDGNPSFWNRLATEVLGAHEPPTLTPAVRAILLNHRVPLRDPGILTTLPEPSPAEIALLSHAALLVKDKATLLGVLLEPDAKAAPGEPRG